MKNGDMKSGGGMRYWLGVVCRDHVQLGTARGIAQLGHGKRDGLARLSAGDWLVYYSPRTSLRGGEPLQAFTALGELPDDDIWQAHEGDFHPWRRRVAYREDTVETPIRSLALDLTAGPNWGYQLRRGLITLTEHDFATISAAMAGTTPAVPAAVPASVGAR
ncbi:EVE domain-containing protein [Hamadaea tsunoensis]|uniref:EVE domain-containing protein n=1 Tax=Hamadaea tsunoensis TaxID=53368 RepID=UPI001FE223E1|nr:EVE domain-containing protein [Hamadaea tsunoensis]